VCFRTSASDAPIFGAAEQESIQWNHHDVRPYAAITRTQFRLPPASNALGGKGCRIVINAHADPACILRYVVHPV
jgi:hypothetical protein